MGGKGDKMISDRDTAGQEQIESVDIIASGYEWICLKCDEFQHIIAYPKTGMVQCEQCGTKFCVDLPEHAME
jgi:hypothetical protein